MEGLSFLWFILVPFGIVFFAVWLVLAIFFLLNLRDVLRQVSPQNQAMQPDHVWFNLIPIFNLVWMFVTVIKVRDSLVSEYRTRGWAQSDDSGFGVGLAAAILSVLGWFGSIPALVCWIIYWVKMSDVKQLLVQSPTHTSQPPAPPPPPADGAGVAGGRCPYCGADRAAGARFCSSCGRPIS